MQKLIAYSIGQGNNQPVTSTNTTTITITNTNTTTTTTTTTTMTFIKIIVIILMGKKHTSLQGACWGIFYLNAGIQQIV